MPGLINKENRCALPLSVSDITCCVRGYTLALTASMTYENIEDHAIEGIFIYPLEENSIVVGFEAMISSQIITLQVKSKAKIEDCYLDGCNSTNGALQSSSGLIVMDEDYERTVLVVNLGNIPPMETVHILVSTSSELSTLPSGGIRVSTPKVCTPRVQRTINEEQGLSPNFSRTRDRHTYASSLHDQNAPQLWLASLLEEETINSMDYEFNFQLEIRAPYLLAGVESPSHAIRADADPHARSATSVVITLADKYTYDYPVQIIIYPSEPHLPHVLIENGDMPQEEYDEYLHSRSDFIKATKKDSSNEKKVDMQNENACLRLLTPPHIVVSGRGFMLINEHWERAANLRTIRIHECAHVPEIKSVHQEKVFIMEVDVIHRRLHKDILHNPVVMLNYCPDLKCICSDLRKVHGEYIFLIDRSGSMSGANINRVKDAMVVILKSLVPGCRFNIIGFGSTFKSLFTTSQCYEEEALALACEYIRKVRADMGGTNILPPLTWILRQPTFSGHPRLLFLLTDGAVSNTGRVIELVRSHARYIRCFTFGIGQNACRRLVQGLATVSKGTAEYLADGERLQPKMIKSLKKTMSPVLSDISIEWLFPETKEVLLSPVGNTFLFPGDSLIGYSVVCDTTRYHDNPKSSQKQDKRRRYSMMRSTGSASSVFYHSQEEEPVKMGSHRETPSDPPYDSHQDSLTDSSPVITEQDIMVLGETSPRRRAYSTNQITDYNPSKKVYTPSDPSSVVLKNPLRRTKVQELIGQMSPEHEAQWKNDYQPQLASLCATSFSGRPASSHKQEPPLKHEDISELHSQPQLQDAPQPGGASVTPAACNPVRDDGSRSSTDSPSLGSVGETDGYGHQLCQAETPQETQLPDLQSANQRKGDCKAVVSGLFCGKPMKWEVVFDIEPFLNGREREEKVHEELWNETFHYLAGRSIIQDFEQMADKECEIEHGSGRKYQLYATHTSKACNILSKYTAFVPIDLDTNEYLPTCVEYINPGEGLKKSSRSRSGSRKNRVYSIGLGRSQSGGMSEEAEEVLLPNSGDDGLSPCSTPSSAGWEKCSFTEVSQRSPSVTSDQSQKSVESLFSARLALSRTRLLTRAAKGFMCRSHSKSGDSIGESDNENKDYIPLVLLQLASGAFPLDSALCEAINVPMDKLKWTSPFTSHRTSLGHLSHPSSRCTESTDDGCRSPFGPEAQQQAAEHAAGIISLSQISRSAWSDAGANSSAGPSAAAEPPPSPYAHTDGVRSSGSGGSDIASAGGVLKRMLDPESMVWATAVALAWLEHSSASYFIEWELVAAKASMWLSTQDIPEGKDLASIKAAANQLFIILRHWDENLQLNMLCYNPNSV